MCGKIILQNQHGKKVDLTFNTVLHPPLTNAGVCAQVSMLYGIGHGGSFYNFKEIAGKSSKLSQKLTHPHVVTCHPNQNLGRFLDHQLGGFQHNNYLRLLWQVGWASAKLLRQFFHIIFRDVSGGKTSLKMERLGSR